MDLIRLFHTVKYLKPVQIYGRVWHRLYRPRVPSLSSPSIRLPGRTLILPIEKKKTLVAPTRFRFLNQEHGITNASDWNDLSIDKLWLYNLHYFDYLNEKNDEQENEICRSVIERWIRENPPFAGNGWEPYTLSLRIVNWIKWVLAGNKAAKERIDSFYLQAWYLRRKLEIHLLGNHLFANAKALIFSGLFFEGREAEEWLKKGLQILAREVPEQILGDGGHFERSPMYHSIILEDLLDLINILRAYDQEPPPLWFDSVERMRYWLKAMCHPDGQISFFNDAAFEIAAEPVEIEKYAGRLGFSAGESPQEGVTELRDSGYVRLQKGDAVLVADVGKIGPDYLPGHAHADTLSFELSLKGRRVFINSGTSCYGNSTERLAQRGTASHNTVMIDGEDSSEVWSGFRVAQRAYPLEINAKDGGVDGLWLTCSHNGYNRLKGKPTHCRGWLLAENSLEIRDRINGDYSEALAFYYLYPGLTVDSHTKKISSDDIVFTYETDGDVSVENKYYYPEFGMSVPNECLVVKPVGRQYHIKFTWA